MEMALNEKSSEDLTTSLTTNCPEALSLSLSTNEGFQLENV